MAVISGKDGVVAIGASTLIKVTEFNFSFNTPLVSTSGMGEDQHSYVSGMSDTSLNITVNHDGDDSVQAGLRGGASIVVKLQPAGVGSGRPEWNGTVVIETATFTTAAQGVPTIAVSAKGPLVESAQT